MLNFLWIVPAVPFLGFLLLAFFGRRFSRYIVETIGVGSIGLSALFAILISINFMTSPPAGYSFSQTLWVWMSVGGFSPGISFYLDSMTVIFMLVITIVGFLIHMYSAEYMLHEEGYSRFFAYMNLFVGSMLTLVLADNLVLLYLGWEGVGLCSYLLIGFLYKDPANGLAARKAFVVTRVGDTAMGLGLFLLYTQLGTLQIQGLLTNASNTWQVGSPLAIAAAALLLGGAVGKSAQLPLQTWLPDAMAGPTPTSALIHAATMVTAGVYLIARTHVIFELAPIVMTFVAIVGAATLLISGFTALTQVDIKRVLAYSTISQIGYMFLALGVGAWAAGIFHFMIHAFFKALLFLGAGAIIVSLHHEQNMFKMGGLKDKLPVTFWTFLAGSASLAALPLVTAGFYSKDAILWYSFSSEQGSPWFYAIALLGAFITSIYTFRMVFITFFGEAKTEISHPPGKRIKIPLIVLGVLSIIGGFIELPHTLGYWPAFSDFMSRALPEVHVPHELYSIEWIFQVIAGVLTLIGIYIAYQLFLKNTSLKNKITENAVSKILDRFWFSGWGFDWVYDRLFVQPYIWLANINKKDVFDLIYSAIAAINRVFHVILTLTQTGRLRWYAVGIVFGAIVTLYVVVFA
jgi:NADH-quinone oxidoreductase subunit L